MNDKERYPIVIGGAGRTGKSLFVKYLSMAMPTEHLVFNRDLNLHKTLSKEKLKNFAEEKVFLKEFFNKEFYIDPKKDKKINLANLLNVKVSIISAKVQNFKYPKICLESIIHALKIVTEFKNKQTWVIYDIHAEFYYSFYKKVTKNLKLIVLQRNLSEVVCAHLLSSNSYKDSNKIQSKFWYSITFWLLSKKVTNKLKEKYNTDVIIINTKNLYKNYKIASLFDLKKINFPSKLYYDFKPNKKLFFTRQKVWKKYLNDYQLEIIKLIENFNFMKLWSENKILLFDKLKIFLIILFANVGRYNPPLAKYIITCLFFPKYIYYSLKSK